MKKKTIFITVIVGCIVGTFIYYFKKIRDEGWADEFTDPINEEDDDDLDTIDDLDNIWED